MAPLPPELQLYCRMLDEGADNYTNPKPKPKP